jgi:hypothetical protein
MKLVTKKAKRSFAFLVPIPCNSIIFGILYQRKIYINKKYGENRKYSQIIKEFSR